MEHFVNNWRAYVQAATIVAAELLLFGAAEGPHKMWFMGYGTMSIASVAVAFKVL